MNDLIEFLSKHQDSITTGTATRLAEELGVEIDLDQIA